MTKKAIKICNIAFPILAIVTAMATCRSYDAAKACFRHGGYYIFLSLFLFWLASLVRNVREEKETFFCVLRASRAGIFFSLFLAVVIFVSVKPYFKMLSDETNLLAVSKSLTYERKPENVTMGKWYYFNFWPIERPVAIRPLLFPFMTHLLHTFFGFRAVHPFVLNFFALAGLFSLIFILFRTTCGPPWAYLAVLLAAAQPVLSTTATSAGFDFFFAFFAFWSFFSLRSFLASPSPARFQVLWMNLLMLTHARYEAPFFFVCVLFFLLLFGAVKKEFFTSSIVYSLTPFWFLSLFWQRIYGLGKDLLKKPELPMFSADYFSKNCVHFFKSMLSFDFFLPYASLINLLGMIAIVYFLYCLLVKKRPGRAYERRLFLITGVSLAAFWCFYMFYAHGNASRSSSGRYFVLFALCLSLMAALFLYRMQVFGRRPVVIFLLGIFFFAVYHPVAIESRFSHQLTLPRRYRIGLDFFKRQKTKNFLIITNRPGQFTAQNFGAVDFEYAKKNKEGLIRELARHLYDDIFVVQEILISSHKPTRYTELDPELVTEPVYELKGRSDWYLRISRIVLPRPRDKILAEAEKDTF